MVAEGALLVSPGIVQDFAKQPKNVMSWETVPKKFLKLGLHESVEVEGGLNVHKYLISGSNKSTTIMTLLIKDTGLLLPLPKPKGTFGKKSAFPEPFFKG